MTNIADRLAALEAENSRLRADLDALKPAPAPAPAAPYIEPGASITYLTPGFPFTMPSEEELRRLLAIVVKSYPFLEEQQHRLDPYDTPFNSFKASFRAVGMTGRTTEPVDTVSLSFYVDFFNHDLLRPARVYHDVTYYSVLAAVVAHGDVPFRPFEQEGWTFGLAHRVNSGIPSKDAWRKVLSSGVAPRPTHPVRYVRPYQVKRIN